MASLREEARRILDDAKDGILWIAIWKTGRTWHAETMLGTEYEEGHRYPVKRDSRWIIDEDDAEALKEILESDENAILVNAYFCNLGPLEGMTLESLIDGIKFQYSLGVDIGGILQMAEETKKAMEAEKQRAETVSA